MVELPENDLTGFTIISVQGTTLTLSSSSGVTDEWSGGLLRITSGDHNLMTTAIVGNNGTTLTISTPFDPVTASQIIGATCEIQGGPLRDATIFHIQPKSIKNLIEDGKDAFVYINPLDVAKSKRALGGNNSSLHAARNQIRAFTLQITASVPFITGSTTAETAYINQTKVYDLEEQLTARLLMFTSLNRFPLADEFDITTSFGLLEPDGGQKSEIAVMEFGLALAL